MEASRPSAATSVEPQTPAVGLGRRQLACAQCRAAKIKCKPSQQLGGEERATPCSRCVQHSLQCEVPRRKKRQRTTAPRASSNDYESSPRPPPSFDPSGGSQPRLQSNALAFSPPNIWSLGPGLAGPNPQSNAGSEGPGAHDFFSIRMDPPRYQALSSTAPASNPSANPPPAVEQSDILSLFLDAEHGGSRQVQLETFRQSSSQSETPIHHGSEGGTLSYTSGPTHQRRTTSARQELQDAKRDYGIPATRDGSRNTSVDLGEDTSRRQILPSGLLEGSGYAPCVPGVLEAEDVTQLFNQFFEFHNTCAAVLDPALHTPAFVHARSALLFHVILAVTAEVFRSDLYDVLWKRAKSMLDQAFAEAEESIELCQAVSLMFLWRRMEDRSGALRLGFAVRIAHHLGLDHAPKRPLPEDEMAARLQLNCERTWIQLSHADALINGFYGGIPTLPQYRSVADTEAWVADHPQYTCASDNALNFAAAWLPLLTFAASVFGVGTESTEAVDNLHHLRSLHLEFCLRWRRLRPPNGVMIGSFYTFARWSEKGGARDLTNMARLAAGDADRAKTLWDDIYAAIDSLRELSNDLSESGLLFWASSSVALHAAKCGMLLAKYMTMLTPTIAQGIMSIFEDIHLACLVDVGKGNRKEYLAKLFGSLLRLSASRLTAASSGPIGGLHQDAGPSGTDMQTNLAQWQETAMSSRINVLPGLEPDATLSTDELDRWMAGLLED